LLDTARKSSTRTNEEQDESYLFQCTAGEAIPVFEGRAIPSAQYATRG
jgi:hypothetical protein